MVAGRPYYHAYPADFFTATQGWSHENKGAYRLLIDLLNERDRPIPDDPKFIAGVLGCPVQRWKKIRSFLLDEGKLMLNEYGELTNPRFEREHMSRADQREASKLNGHLGAMEKRRRAGQEDMDFEAPRTHARARTDKHENRNKVGKNIEVSSKKDRSPSPEKKMEPVETNDLAQAPPSLPCARNSSETIVQEDSSLPNGDSNPREPGRLANADLKTLYDECCDAAGYNPISPAAIDRAMTHVEKWRDLGIDFDLIVIPSIRAVVLATDEPTRTLGRFEARIAHEFAKVKAAAKKAKPYVPPQIPKLNPDGEDPSFLPLRTDLLEKLGDQSYCLAFNGIVFEDAGPCQGDKHPLKVTGPSHRTEPLTHGRWRSILLSSAKPHGFTDIW